MNFPRTRTQWTGFFGTMALLLVVTGVLSSDWRSMLAGCVFAICAIALSLRHQRISPKDESDVYEHLEDDTL